MNYNVISHSYVNTGGYCMISVFEVWLPDENRTVFVNVSDEYCTITTVNHIMSDIEIDDYDKITIATLCYKLSDYCTVTNEYFDLCRYCVFEHLKADYKFMGCIGWLPFAWLLPVYQQQISNVERQFVENEVGDCFDTDGYSVIISTEDGHRVITMSE